MALELYDELPSDIQETLNSDWNESKHSWDLDEMTLAEAFRLGAVHGIIAAREVINEARSEFNETSPNISTAYLDLVNSIIEKLGE